MKQLNKLDECIDNISFITANSVVGIAISAKVAQDSLPKTKRYRVADKIGKIINKLDL